MLPCIKTGLKWKAACCCFCLVCAYVVFLWPEPLYMNSLLCPSVKSNIYVYVCFSTWMNFAVPNKRWDIKYQSESHRNVCTLETFVSSVWQPDLMKHNKFFQNKIFISSFLSAVADTTSWIQILRVKCIRSSNWQVLTLIMIQGRFVFFLYRKFHSFSCTNASTTLLWSNSVDVSWYTWCFI